MARSATPRAALTAEPQADLQRRPRQPTPPRRRRRRRGRIRMADRGWPHLRSQRTWAWIAPPSVGPPAGWPGGPQSWGSGRWPSWPAGWPGLGGHDPPAAVARALAPARLERGAPNPSAGGVIRRARVSAIARGTAVPELTGDARALGQPPAADQPGQRPSPTHRRGTTAKPGASPITARDRLRL